MRAALLASAFGLLAVASPAAQAQPSQAGFSPGFGFWVGDARGIATLRTAMQARFSCDSTLTGDDPCDATGFLLRRARVRLGAVLAEPSAELALQADLADQDQPLEEAYALVRPWSAVRIAAGLLRVPVLREGLYAEELVPLAELSPLADRMQPGRDLGLLFGVRVGRLDATIGAWNGAPRLFENDNIDLLYAARMSIDLVGGSPAPVVAGDPSPVARAVPGAVATSRDLYASLGVGGLYDLPRSTEDGAGDPANARVQAVVADLALRFREASLDLAGALRETDRGALEEPTDLERELAATATFAWAFVSPRIVPAARFTWMQERPVSGPTERRWQLAAGASWRFGAPDLVTVVVEYDLEHAEGQDDVHRGLAELRLVL